jgi:hypothetical protein
MTVWSTLYDHWTAGTSYNEWCIDIQVYVELLMNVGLL